MTRGDKHLKRGWSYFLIIGGASLWGVIGFFVQSLSDFGFSAMEIVTLRVVSAFVILLVYVLLIDPKAFKINWKDSIYFIGTGILSIVFFNWSYFTAMKEISISIAVILLYTAPAFVTILSVIFLKEKLNKRKIVSLIITIAGCIFVTGLISSQAITISM